MTIRAIIPPNLGPGRRLIVQAPDGRRVEVLVPEGSKAGSVILVTIPAETIDRKSKHQNRRAQQQRQTQKHQSPSSGSGQPTTSNSIQIIRVPKNITRRGQHFKVRLPDGRTIEAALPYDGCREFSLDTRTQSRQQKQQNWHDNVLSVAPMSLGPSWG